MNALILGGGRPDDELCLASGAPAKALVPINGVPMAAFVLRALRESGRIERITYVGPVNDLLRGLVDEVLPDCGALIDNLESGLRALSGSPRILIGAADAPFLSAASVRALLDADPGAAFVYPIVPRAVVQAAFPEGKRTYARVREGTFTGGNFFLVSPAFALGALPWARRMLENRKNPLAMVRLLGVGFAIRFLLGRLTLADLEGFALRLFKQPSKLLIVRDASIGVDVDKPSDLALAEARLSA